MPLFESNFMCMRLERSCKLRYLLIILCSPEAVHFARKRSAQAQEPISFDDRKLVRFRIKIQKRAETAPPPGFE